ncbi:MAG: preprotein translocase subunit YajC, partial [Chitinivibrionales bacterium]|nr:preprotein translocase subunit YajC [Chitinivibrionales bacterium]
MFLMMGVILAVMYLLMIRPEQKKQKERQSMLSALKKGNRVVTTGGIHGTVWNVKE